MQEAFWPTCALVKKWSLALTKILEKKTSIMRLDCVCFVYLRTFKSGILSLPICTHQSRGLSYNTPFSRT